MEHQPVEGVTVKSLLIASLLIPINCYWVIEMEVIRYSGHPVTISLFFNVIFSLFIVIGINQFLRWLSPRSALNQGELIIIYLMLSIASGITGHDMLEILVPMLGHAFRFATPENEWRELFLPFLPEWLTVSDGKVARGYYEGEVKSLYPRTANRLGIACSVVDHVYLSACFWHVLYQCHCSPAVD